jgi:hypothetical protein
MSSPAARTHRSALGRPCLDPRLHRELGRPPPTSSQDPGHLRLSRPRPGASATVAERARARQRAGGGHPATDNAIHPPLRHQRPRYHNRRRARALPPLRRCRAGLTVPATAAGDNRRSLRLGASRIMRPGLSVLTAKSVVGRGYIERHIALTARTAPTEEARPQRRGDPRVRLPRARGLEGLVAQYLDELSPGHGRSSASERRIVDARADQHTGPRWS